jgi:flagellar hook-length control protein FliK
MMSTLSSTLLSLKTSPAAAPPVPSQANVAQNKRFAQIMAKAQSSAPPAAPLVQAKPTPPEKPTPAEGSSEAIRADANARANAKAAARLVATRALVKAPASEVNLPNAPRIEPHIEPHTAAPDSATTEANQPNRKTADATAALAADMAAWVAALNPPSTQTSTEAAIAEPDVTTQMVTQSAGQIAVDKNTQVLREEADEDKHGDAQHDARRGVGGPRGAADLNRSRAESDGAGQAGRDGQPSESRGSREAHEARASSRATADLHAAPAAASAIATLNKESAVTTATTIATLSSSADFSTLIASNLNVTNAANGTPDALTLSLSTPLNAPEFRDALGLQVSLLARDGVQTAELHLNPAEMGPVSIQIVMDGNQARVDFGADVAATRAAIEASMPELASAMRDAGFTLAGGGVSQHAKGQDPSAGESRQGSTRRNLAASAASAATSTDLSAQPRVQLRAGGVDLFA